MSIRRSKLMFKTERIAHRGETNIEPACNNHRVIKISRGISSRNDSPASLRWKFRIRSWQGQPFISSLILSLESRESRFVDWRTKRKKNLRGACWALQGHFWRTRAERREEVARMPKRRERGRSIVREENWMARRAAKQMNIVAGPRD